MSDPILRVTIMDDGTVEIFSDKARTFDQVAGLLQGVVDGFTAEDPDARPRRIRDELRAAQAAADQETLPGPTVEAGEFLRRLEEKP